MVAMAAVDVKVLRLIVDLVAVSVVYFLLRFQWTSQHLLGHQDVFQYIAVRPSAWMRRHTNHPVTLLRFDVTAALPGWIVAALEFRVGAARPCPPINLVPTGVGAELAAIACQRAGTAIDWFLAEIAGRVRVPLCHGCMVVAFHRHHKHRIRPYTAS